MTYEMQAISGIADIGPMTFGELLHACKAKVDFEWGQTSALMALIANCNRGRNTRAFRRDDFYKPQLHRRKKRGNMSVDKLHALKPMFTKR
jgi:hypothetical protein